MPRVEGNKYETWLNSTRGTVVLKKFDRAGNLTDEVIHGGKQVHVTSDERRLNQEMCAEETLDFFQNGILTPVRLIETADDVEKFKDNPNHISEDEMKGLFKSKTGFNARVNKITNPIALQRLLEIARGDEVDATLKQVETINGRLKDVAPSLYTEVENVQTPGAAAGGQRVHQVK